MPYKILFIGDELIGDDSATGATLKSFFCGLPNTEILQYSLNPFTKHNTLYRTIYAQKCNGWINYYVYKIHEKNKIIIPSRNSKKSSLLTRLINNHIKKTVLKIQDIEPMSISKEAILSIREFKPNMIYTLGGGIACLSISQKFGDLLNIPIIIHSMDDHIHTKYSGKGLLNLILRKNFYKLNSIIYSKSKIGLAICPKMAEEYAKEFGIDFYYAMNSISNISYYPAHTDDTLLIIFSGGIHGGRDKTLLQLFDYINEYNEKSKHCRKVVLEVYTNKAGCQILTDESNDNIHVFEYVPREQLFQNLSRADILLHVESFQETEQKYFRLSCSTKIPEYLSVGRPILVISPKDVGTTDYLNSTDAAFVFNNVEDCKEIFSIDKSELHKMEENSRALATKNHLSMNVHNTLLSAFKKLLTNI